MSGRRVRVLVAAAVRMYEEGLSAVIGDDERFELVGSASSRHAMLERVAGIAQPPDVVVIDLGREEGIAAVRSLRRTLPAAGVIALAVGDDDEDVVAFAEAGVAALVARETSISELNDLIECVAEGGSPTEPRIGAVLLRRLAARADEARLASDPRALTARERDVARLIDRGLSNKEIAAELHIELPTVKNHVHAILEKVDVGHRAEAVAVLRSRGLLD